MSSPLAEKLRNRIDAGEHIGVDAFMHTALLDPEHGYYTTRQVFGADGDFITAPEVSQVFGEVLAAYLTANIMDAKLTEPATVVEFGPGRGTLMKDMLRSFKAMPAELHIKEVLLVEASERLKQMQQENLADSHLPLRWITNASELPKSPCFIVANEFFDALPIRQFICEGEKWQELVLAAEGEELVFHSQHTELPECCESIIATCKHTPSDAKVLPLRASDINKHTDRVIFEYPEAAIDIMQTLCAHIRQYGGMLVLVDYGHTMHGFGDTLQAVKKHQFVDVLSDIGEADITAHVNFAWMKEVAEEVGLSTHLLAHQGKFLRALGAELRAMSLCEGLDKNGQVTIASGLERLISPMQMGELFKVLVVAHPDLKILDLGI